jgi:IPT/TIG domain
VSRGWIGLLLLLLITPAWGQTITSVTPTTLTQGSTPVLTVTGTGFVTGTVLSVNGAPRGTTVDSPTQLRATLSATDTQNPGVLTLTVSNPPVTVSVQGGPPPGDTAPRITGLTPSSVPVGSAGQAITITGTGFTPSFFAYYGGAQRSATFVSATQIQMTLWSSDFERAGTYGVMITNWTAQTGNVNSNVMSLQVAGPITPPGPGNGTPPPSTSIDALPAGHWMAAGTNTLRSVLPSPLPPGNPAAVMTAWSGGAYDTTRNRLLVWGGGHGDYAGNELYAFDLATLTWSRVWGPSPNIPAPGPSCPNTYADGNPVARHTYDGLEYLPTQNRFWALGGSKACGSGAAGFDLWTFEGTAWTERAPIPQTMLGLTTAYDPQTGHVFVQSSTGFYEYDPTANRWTERGRLGTSLSEDKVRTGVIDPTTRKFVVLGDGEFFAWDLTTWQLIRPSTTAPTGRAPGLAYDPTSQRIIAWAGGATIYSLDTTTWTWSTIAPAAGNTVTPSAPPPAGTYGRFRYVPSKGVFLVVNSIDEPVYIYRLQAAVTPPATGQIDVPIKQWVALPAPPNWSTQGLPYTFKHVTPSYHPPSGRIYFTGGDYSGAIVNGVGQSDSYRQETWSLSIKDKYAAPTDLGAGWRLEYPYCGPTGKIQPKHPDYVGFPWDAKRQVFHMVPGVMEAISFGDCPGETPDKGDNPGFVSGRIMTFDPATTTWAIRGPGFNPESQDTWFSVLDPVTDTLLQFSITMKVNAFNLASQTWSIIANLPNASLWKEYLAADLVARVIYAIDGLTGTLWRYNMDARTFTSLGPVPGGAWGYTNITYIAWDTNSRRLFWHQEGSSFYAYDPASKAWEPLAISTNVPGVNATGRSIIYDPGQNVIVLYGGTTNPQPYLFLYRYAPAVGRGRTADAH